MKTVYERPIIVKNVSGFSNKFAVSSKMKVIDTIDGISVNELAEQFGSPVFVFSEDKIRQHYRRYLHAFKSRYPKVQFAWSYKTNYLKAISAIYHQEGSIAEVVSDFEYEKAKRLGVMPEDIIYNGPLKEAESLKKAAAEGAKIHIDNFEELTKLEKIYDSTGIRAKIAIRINMDTGIKPAWTRFGFNLENGEALWCIKRIIKMDKMDLQGLHTHIGTFILSPQAYVNAANNLIDLYEKIKAEHNITLEYIDLGGGFPSQNKLKAKYIAPGTPVPNIEQYAEQITNTLLERFPYENGPKVYFETGRALIDEAGYLITSVAGSQRLPDNRRALILDGGVNLLFTSYFYDVGVYPGQDYNGTLEPTTLYGPLCMNIDVIRDYIKLPHLSVGDKLVLSPVGAYSVTQWMQFIRMRPAVVLISSDKKTFVIRRAETIDDVEAPEILPDKYRMVV